ncbi:urease accessory protein UreD [Streptomyces genisteinicus]|uniref:Urease accessory protein UreD n=1 Tax=Streptomyces genisteinicus TaxID=2768068 RepID=A0A7H0HNK8_9ACTN|nr:urease accessory protein UreD [Streptomyces genisteinicus]QNP62124.1 urease accessory protein UreD [Streptomyces genisteinicus]
MSVQAAARIVADGTALPVLTGDGPLALRRTRTREPGLRVTVVGAMSAPLGGDRLRIDAEVRPGTRLIVDSAAATISLPGRGGATAHYDVALRVGDDAVLHWLPEQLVAAQGSTLRMSTRVDLAATARLVLREEQILGRHGEDTGTLVTRLTVHRDGRPLLDGELAFGPGAHGGWDGPAVLGGHRAVGQLLVVDPDFAESPPPAGVRGPRTAVTPLAGPAALVTAVAADARELRAVLDDALGELAPFARGG